MSKLKKEKIIKKIQEHQITKSQINKKIQGIERGTDKIADIVLSLDDNNYKQVQKTLKTYFKSIIEPVIEPIIKNTDELKPKKQNKIVKTTAENIAGSISALFYITNHEPFTNNIDTKKLINDIYNNCNQNNQIKNSPVNINMLYTEIGQIANRCIEITKITNETLESLRLDNKEPYLQLPDINDNTQNKRSATQSTSTNIQLNIK